MKDEKKLNLICRMAGNIYRYDRNGTITSEESVETAFRIFNEVEKRIAEEGEE